MSGALGALGASEIGGYIQLGAVLVNVLGAGIEQAKTIVSTVKAELHPNMTDEELNSILAGVASDADRRKALADQDAKDAEAAIARDGDSSLPKP